MAYAIRAWRDGAGRAGITIGTLFPVGYDNHVAEIDLADAEIDRFIADCADARQRARDAPRPMHEPLPGAYEAAGWTRW